jgi:hypothetical protein
VAFEPYAGAVTETRLVFIGRDVDAAPLGEALDACRATQTT